MNHIHIWTKTDSMITSVKCDMIKRSRSFFTPHTAKEKRNTQIVKRAVGPTITDAKGIEKKMHPYKKRCAHVKQSLISSSLGIHEHGSFGLGWSEKCSNTCAHEHSLKLNYHKLSQFTHTKITIIITQTLSSVNGCVCVCVLVANSNNPTIGSIFHFLHSTQIKLLARVKHTITNLLIVSNESCHLQLFNFYMLKCNTTSKKKRTTIKWTTKRAHVITFEHRWNTTRNIGPRRSRLRWKPLM